MQTHFDVKELAKWKKEDLQKLASEMGLSDGGTKEELAKRLQQKRWKCRKRKNHSSQKHREKLNRKHQRRKVSETDTEKDSVRVTVIETYRDKLAQQTFEPGTEFVVTAERAEVLVAAGVAKITK